MRTFSNKTRPYSNSNFGIESEDSDIVAGWEVEVDNPKTTLNKNSISEVNKNLLIMNLLDKFNINLENVYSPSGWTYRCSCPLPGHSDRSPSFNVHPEENRFWCFGCSRGGGPVQFYAYMYNKTVFEAAQFLIEKNNLSDKLSDNEDYSEDIFNEMSLFSDRVNEFIKNNKSAKDSKFIDNVCWTLDIYLEKNLVSRKLDLNNLKARINILIGKINKYEQQNINNR